MDFSEEIKIDKHMLDYEWERQPSLVSAWQDKYADAILDKDRKKEQVELLYAEIEHKVRDKPESYGIKKVTEGSIKSAVIQQEKYKKLVGEYHIVKRDCEILAGARNALEHKKKALEYLTQLYISGYWSEPRIKKEDRKEVTEKSEKQQQEKLEESKRLKKRGEKKK